MGKRSPRKFFRMIIMTVLAPVFVMHAACFAASAYFDAVSNEVVNTFIADVDVPVSPTETEPPTEAPRTEPPTEPDTPAPPTEGTQPPETTPTVPETVPPTQVTEPTALPTETQKPSETVKPDETVVPTAAPTGAIRPPATTPSHTPATVAPGSPNSGYYTPSDSGQVKTGSSGTALVFLLVLCASVITVLIFKNSLMNAEGETLERLQSVMKRITKRLK